MNDEIEAPTMFERMEQIVEALSGLNDAEADALLEAVRVQQRLTPGPTTRADALRLLAETGVF